MSADSVNGGQFLSISTICQPGVFSFSSQGDCILDRHGWSSSQSAFGAFHSPFRVMWTFSRMSTVWLLTMAFILLVDALRECWKFFWLLSAFIGLIGLFRFSNFLYDSSPPPAAVPLVEPKVIAMLVHWPFKRVFPLPTRVCGILLNFIATYRVGSSAFG